MGILDFLRPAHESDNPERRLNAVGHISDQSLLAQLAKTDISPRVRAAAVKAIDDPQQLTDVALDGKHIDTRIVAVEKIDSQERLAEIIKTRKNSKLMGACFARITDTGILKRIAEDTGYNISARRMAVENFADESYLAEIAPSPDRKGAGTSPEEIDFLIAKYTAPRLVRIFGKYRGSKSAVLALGELARRGGEPGLGAIDYLAISLKHANPEIHQTAADQLATLSDAEQVTYLIRMMDNAQLHPKILEVLARIDHPEARQIVKQES